MNIGDQIPVDAKCIGIMTSQNGTKTYDYRVGAYQVQADANGRIVSMFVNPCWAAELPGNASASNEVTPRA